jgi:hypothetical protein
MIAGVVLLALVGVVALGFWLGQMPATPPVQNTSPLAVVSTPDGVQVAMDGQLLGTTPFTAHVANGVHSLQADLDGFDSQRLMINVPTWQNEPVRIQLVPRRPPLVLTYTPSPLEVFCDGVSLGEKSSPFSLTLKEGVHKVGFVHPGYEPQERVVKVDSGPVASLQVNLVALGTLLRVESSPPGATVYVDGQAMGTTPYASTDLKPGSHTLRVAHPGYLTASRSADLQVGTPLNIEATLQPRP